MQRVVGVGRAVAPSATTVVLAGLNAAATDGVVAAPLAHALGAPLLLTDAAALSPSVATELRRRKATRVVVVGGTTAVTPAVLDLAAGPRRDHGRADRRGHRPTPPPLPSRGPSPRCPAPRARRRRPASCSPRCTRHAGPRRHRSAACAAATGRPVLYLTSRGFPVDTVTAMRALGVTSATVVGGTDEFSDRAARGFTTLDVASVDTGHRHGARRCRARARPHRARRPAGAPGTAWAGAPTDAGLPDVVAAGAAGRPVLLLPAVVTRGIGDWFRARRPRQHLGARRHITSARAPVRGADGGGPMSGAPYESTGRRALRLVAALAAAVAVTAAVDAGPGPVAATASSGRGVAGTVDVRPHRRRLGARRRDVAVRRPGPGPRRPVGGADPRRPTTPAPRSARSPTAATSGSRCSAA